jgi:hypothetical protein
MFASGPIGWAYLGIAVVATAIDMSNAIEEGNGQTVIADVMSLGTGGVGKVLQSSVRLAKTGTAAQEAAMRESGTEGWQTAWDTASASYGIYGISMAPAMDEQQKESRAERRAESDEKKQRKHAENLANDIADMKASQCPSMVGVVPIPGPCPDSDISMQDPMKNKYCGVGMNQNLVGCVVFGADGWNGRQAEKQGPKKCWSNCGWNGWGGWGPSLKPQKQPQRDPYPQYSGYHTQAYLDMKYR